MNGPIQCAHPLPILQTDEQYKNVRHLPQHRFQPPARLRSSPSEGETLQLSAMQCLSLWFRVTLQHTTQEYHPLVCTV